MAPEPAAPRNRNRRTVLLLSGLVATMTALAFASVPLYRVFCESTGFNGTTNTAK